MSKLRDRILVITDLLLGAAYADARLDGAERDAVRGLLRELLGGGALPPEVEARVEKFSGQGFDLHAAARAFALDPPMQKRKLLELVAKVHDADGEVDLDEDDYLVELAKVLAVPEADYRDLTLNVEVEELRTNLAKLRPPPLPPGARGSVDVDVDG
ncbi:MAG TPA: TerB family tellurite resistance protein [Polyangiaceae bacterium]|nr:TerB family tellurite resistance protein [Polyangiaceae bacterium]